MKNIVYIVITIVILFAIVGCKQEKKSNSKKAPVAVQKASLKKIDSQAYFNAALNGDLNIVKKAIQSGLDINATDKDGHTALIFAAYNGHSKVVNYLIENGAFVNLANINNRTALMLASSGPFIETVEILLNADADPDIADNVENFTALMFAAAEGQLDVVKILINNGADKTLKDTDGDTAFDFAVENGHSEVVAFLK